MKKFSDKTLTIASIIFVSLALILFIIGLFATRPYSLYIVICGWMSLTVSLNINWVISQRRNEALTEIIQKLLLECFPELTKENKNENNE